MARAVATLETLAPMDLEERESPDWEYCAFKIVLIFALAQLMGESNYRRFHEWRYEIANSVSGSVSVRREASFIFRFYAPGGGVLVIEGRQVAKLAIAYVKERPRLAKLPMVDTLERWARVAEA